MEASLALSLAQALLKTLLVGKEMWDLKSENREVGDELIQFVKHLEKSIQVLNGKKLGIKNTTIWTMEALQADLKEAVKDAHRIVSKGLIKSLWDATRTQSELRMLREGVTTSFQTKLFFAVLDVTIDSKQKQDEFQAAMERVQKDSLQAYKASNDSSFKELKAVLRKELKSLFHPVLCAMQSHGQSLEEVVSIIKVEVAEIEQTDDTQKFFSDVLAEIEKATVPVSGAAKQHHQAAAEHVDEQDAVSASTSSTTSAAAILNLQNLVAGTSLDPATWNMIVKVLSDLVDNLNVASSRRESSTSPGGKLRGSSGSLTKWHTDPITWEMMCDPVKASDGRTYDRYTLIDNPTSMRFSPFTGRRDGRPLTILVSDVDVRNRLFCKFPLQEEMCTARRSDFRERALDMAAQKVYADALVMLTHVLDWAENDHECRAKRDEVQRHLDSYLTPSDALTTPPSFKKEQSKGEKGSLNGWVDMELVDDNEVDCGFEEDEYEADWVSEVGESETDRLMEASDSEEEISREPSRDELPEVKERMHLDTRFWSGDNDVAFSEDKLTVTQVHVRNFDDPVVITANLSCGSGLRFPCHYFEMEVKDTSGRGRIAIGLVPPQPKSDEVDGYDEFPGLIPGSWGYHGDSGNMYHDGEEIDVQMPRFGVGDTVGIGVFGPTGQMFFTRNGQRIAVFSNGSSASNWLPLVALQSKRSQVTVNFGLEGSFMLQQPLPSKFQEYGGSHVDLLSVSSGYGTIRIRQDKPRKRCKDFVAALISDHPIPAQSLFYYFEVRVIESSRRRGAISLGFTSEEGFSNSRHPGCASDPSHASSSAVIISSWGYHGREGNILWAGVDLGTPFGGPVLATGDVMGAGFHQGSNQIFITHNGKLVGSMYHNLGHSDIYPTIGLEDVGCNSRHLMWSGESKPVNHVSINLDGQLEPFVPEILPSRLNMPTTATATSGGSTDEYNIADTTTTAVLADEPAPIRSPFYFELGVTHPSFSIGFGDKLHFRGNQHPGMYQHSCGYYGGKIVAGGGREVCVSGAVPKLRVGDTVGAGLVPVENKLFFTVNGQQVASLKCFHVLDSCSLYPTVGFTGLSRTHVQQIRINFNGRDLPFVFAGAL